MGCRRVQVAQLERSGTMSQLDASRQGKAGVGASADSGAGARANYGAGAGAGTGAGADGAGAGAGAGASHHHSKRLDQPQSESARHVPCGIVESHALRKRCGLVPKTRPPLFGRLQFVAESCVRRFFGALAPDVSSATFPPFYMVAQTRCSLVNGVYCKV